MKIALLGYGRMGKEIEKIALKKSHEIVVVINDKTDWKEKQQALKKADVAIDFSIPEVAKENILTCIKMNLPVVVGTTGWYEDLEELTSACKKNKGAFLWASNFSLGVNLMIKINAYSAQLMSKFPEYQASVHEIHHTQKLDAPSGTAISIAQGILGNHEKYKNYLLQEIKEKTSPNILPITYDRAENVTGIHIVDYQSGIDKISLKHEAFNREGFAIGAIVAAEWLISKKGVFTMEDVLS